MQNSKYSIPKKIVLVGASTGGPGQIEKIIDSLFKLEDTTIVIAQHMAMDFIPSFIKRLQIHSINPLRMAQDTDILETGNIYFCYGITSLIQEYDKLRFSVKRSQEYRYNPDIDSVFNSFVPYANDTQLFCIILTGIGEDGVNGCERLSAKGAKCATENRESAIVDGMPSRARKRIKDIEIYDIKDIIEKIKEFCS